jgi:hypothetical protein
MRSPAAQIPAALNGFALWNVLVLLMSCSRMAIPLAFTSDNTARFSGDFISRRMSTGSRSVTIGSRPVADRPRPRFFGVTIIAKGSKMGIT